MASIRKRKWTSGGEVKESWIVDHFDQSGKRHIRTFARKKEAEAFRDEMAPQVRAGTYTADSDSITVGEAGDEWIAEAKAVGLERSTIEQYRTHLKLHIKPFIGNTKISRLTRPGVHDFQRQLREADPPRSPTMIRRVVVSLGAILGNAQERGKLAQNVVAGMSRGIGNKRARKQAKRQKRNLLAGVDFPTKDELRDLLTEADGRWRPLIVTTIFTGLRSSELRGLTWDDVDLTAKTLTVRQRADQWNEMGDPKSDEGKRTIPLGPMVVNTLREWKLVCPRHGKSDKSAGRLYLVFPNGSGKHESHANIINRGLIPLVKKVGAVLPKTDKLGAPVKDKDGAPIMVAKYTGLHALRHVAASLWIEHGFKPKRLQELMGHSSIQMTFDTYGHLWPQTEEDHAAMSQIEARLLG